MKLAPICALLIHIPCNPGIAAQVSSPLQTSRSAQTDLANPPALQRNESDAKTVSESSEERAERMALRFKLAPERISVAVPKGDVPLGNSVEVTLTLAPGKLVDLSSVQRSAGNVVFQSGRPATILRDDGITKTIAVVPAQLGPVDLEIAAAYSDNAVAMHTIRLNVVPSANGLKQFVINGGNIALPLVLEDLEENRQSRINPYVTYRSLDYPIGLSSCEHIKFSIEQSNAVGGPIVEIGRDCMVHALREGKGYLVGDFEGLKDRMLVTVYTKENAPPEFRRARP